MVFQIVIEVLDFNANLIIDAELVLVLLELILITAYDSDNSLKAITEMFIYLFILNFKHGCFFVIYHVNIKA